MPVPVAVAGGFLPSGYTSGQHATHVVGCTAVRTATAGLWEIRLANGDLLTFGKYTVQYNLAANGGGNPTQIDLGTLTGATGITLGAKEDPDTEGLVPTDLAMSFTIFELPK